MEIIFLLAVLLIVPYLVVGAVIILYKGKIKVRKNYDIRPTVSIFLPTFNEEKNIAKKLDNLLNQKYPISEILVYDCSTDGTRKIVQGYQQRVPGMIKLIEQNERIGMARTLNQAFSMAKGEIFIKTDTDSLSRPDALRELISNFADERVGGATGVCIASGGVEKHFRKFMTTIQIAETNMDSTLIAHATSMLAFRRALVEPVSEDSLADDTEEFLLIRKKGYRTVLDPAVISEEEVPEDYMVRRKQKDRRSQGIVRVLLENVAMAFNPKYRKYGMMVLPLEWFILVFSPILLAVFGVVVGIFLYMLNPIFAAVFATVIGLAFVRKTNFLYAIIDTQLSGLMGVLRMLIKGKSNGMWVKAVDRSK